MLHRAHTPINLAKAAQISPLFVYLKGNLVLEQTTGAGTLGTATTTLFYNVDNGVQFFLRDYVLRMPFCYDGATIQTVQNEKDVVFSPANNYNLFRDVQPRVQFFYVMKERQSSPVPCICDGIDPSNGWIDILNLPSPWTQTDSYWKRAADVQGARKRLNYLFEPKQNVKITVSIDSNKSLANLATFMQDIPFEICLYGYTMPEGGVK